MKRVITSCLVAALLCVAATGLSADRTAVDPPKSLQAKAAIEKADASAKSAEAAYRKAVADAKRAELAELKTAQTTATKGGNLTEANAIQAVMDSLVLDLAAMAGTAQNFKVDARQGWQSIGKLAAGTYLVTGSGRWCVNTKDGTWCGPEGIGRPYSPSSSITNIGVLAAKAADHKILIGRRAVITLDVDTELFLCMDDGYRQDNAGDILVSVIRQVDLPGDPVR